MHGVLVFMDLKKTHIIVYVLSNFSFFPPKVSNIWYNHLLRIVQLRTKTPATQQGIGPLIPEQLEEEDSLGIVEWSSWHKSVTINVYATCMFISKTSKLWHTCTSKCTSVSGAIIDKKRNQEYD